MLVFTTIQQQIAKLSCQGKTIAQEACENTRVPGQARATEMAAAPHHEEHPGLRLVRAWNRMATAVWC